MERCPSGDLYLVDNRMENEWCPEEVGHLISVGAGLDFWTLPPGGRGTWLCSPQGLHVAVFVDSLPVFIGHALFELHGFFTEDAPGTPLDFWRFLSLRHDCLLGGIIPTICLIQIRDCAMELTSEECLPDSSREIVPEFFSR